MDLERRMVNLERGMRAWKAICVMQAIAILLVGLAALSRPPSVVKADDGILRARGLVITDQEGRTRVLLGAPLPETKDRLRRDVDYDAMVFLDQEGHDRISLGQDIRAQVNGVVPSDRHRIAEGYGLLIDDPKGNERGGFGFLDIGRAVLALDRPGGDAWGAMVDDTNGFAGTVSYYDRSVGENVTGVISGTQGRRAFLDLKDFNDRPREEFEVGADGKPVLRVLDGEGKVEQQLIPAAAK